MTLIYMVHTQRHAFLVSDRLLTSNGQLIDDKSNKSIMLSANGCFLLVGYTGLARAGSFDTRRFLLERFSSLVPLHFSWQTLLGQLRNDLDAVFGGRPLRGVRDSNKRLAVCFVGVEYADQFTYAIAGSITNFAEYAEPSDDSSVSKFVLRGGRVSAPGMMVVGAWQAVSPEDKSQIFEFIERSVPLEVLAAKIGDRIRAASARPKGATVGRKVSWAMIDRSSLLYTWGQYPHSFLESYSPDLTVLNSDGTLTIGSDFGITGPNPKYDLPAFERARPCPCGSTVQFRHCHGRKFVRSQGLAMVQPNLVPGNPPVWPPDFPAEHRRFPR